MKAQTCGLELDIDSAGLIDYHEGELSDERMRRHAARRGYQLVHRSRPVRTDDFRHFDIIVAMDDKNVQALHRLAPDEQTAKKIVKAASFIHAHDVSFVPDPYYGTAADFEHVLDLLEDCAGGIIASMQNETR